jgi:hypothetical protein
MKMGAVAVACVVAGLSCRHHAQSKGVVSPEVAQPSNNPPNMPAGDGEAWRDEGASLVAQAPVPCTLANKHQDDYVGFTIGYPPGWRVDYSSGSIVVAKDANELEGALIYPGRVRREIRAEDVATTFARGLGQSIRERGGTFEMTDRHTNGRVARATLKATVGGVPLRGPLEVVEKPGFVTLQLYWAPEEEFEAEEPTLRQVLSCFQRRTLITARKPVTPAGGPVTTAGGSASSSVGGAGTTGTTGPGGSSGSSAEAPAQALVPFHGKYYDVEVPAGWRITDPRQMEQGIDVMAPDGHGSVGFGLVINPLKNARTFSRADLERGVLQFWPGVRFLQEGRVPGPPGWAVFGAEWEGSVRGVPLHGYQEVAFGHGIQTTTAYNTSSDRWAAMHATLQTIARSVQPLPAAFAKEREDVRQQLAMYARLYPAHTSSASSGSGSKGSDSVMASWKARQDAQDKASQSFSDAIRGQDRATSPTTGEEYVCPNSMWNTEGPQGPGYYRQTPSGDAELLSVQP